MWRIRQIFRKIKNLIRWFPIIWKDEDWDDHYIFEILKFKLKNQAKYIGNRGYHISAKRDAEIMNTCVRLIDKVQTGYYSAEYFDYEKNKFNLVPIKGTTKHKLEIEYISDNLDDYFNKYPLIYSYVLTKYDLVESEDPEERSRIALYIARTNHERAHKLLFKIIEQNIQGWWD